jgi:hypothetical protein
MSERVQRMSRINVDAEAWTTLRVEALRQATTLADRIGELIESEASRLRADHDEEPCEEPPRPTPDADLPSEQDWSRYRTDGAPGETWIPPWEE